MEKIFPTNFFLQGRDPFFPVRIRPKYHSIFRSKTNLAVLVLTVNLLVLPSCHAKGGETGTSRHRLFPERSYQELALKGLSIPRQEAVFKDPAGNFQVARRGDRIGKEELEVIEITDERVILRGMEGGVPQTAVISLGGGKGPGGSFRFTRRPPVTPGLRAPVGAGGPPK